jgi:hypothetical protein
VHMPKAHLVIHVEQDKQLTARSFFSRGHASKLHETAFRGNHAFPPNGRSCLRVGLCFLAEGSI